MGSPFDAEWVETVRGRCDRVFQAADVGFVAQVMTSETGPALLWEADPKRFVERYPDSGVVESYGSSWPAPCLDYWVYVDVDRGRARLSTEGWNVHDIEVELSGEGHSDAETIVREFARILRVADY